MAQQTPSNRSRLRSKSGQESGGSLIWVAGIVLSLFFTVLVILYGQLLSASSNNLPANVANQAPSRSMTDTVIRRKEKEGISKFEKPRLNWQPPKSSSKDVVIAIPFRHEFASNYDQVARQIKIMKEAEKDIRFHVIVVKEEENVSHFRRAWLLNVALQQASILFSNETCFAVHDLDVLSSGVETALFMSWCDRPTLVSSELSCLNNSLPYNEYARGIVTAKLSDWKTINGFTDSVYDSEGEDEDMYWRFRLNSLLTEDDTLRRPPSGRSKCLSSSSWTNDGIRPHVGDRHRITDRIERLSSGKSDEWRYDGLNSFSFEISEQREDEHGSTWLHVTEKSPVIDYDTSPHGNTTDHLRQKVVLLLPYRDRLVHYRRLMAHIQRLRPKVQRMWDLHVFVVEQLNDDLFRKGWLLNVGFHEISKRFNAKYTCVVQHDIDLHPNLDTVNYAWCDRPSHVCTEIPCFPRTFPYRENAGGVVTASLADWVTINGYTNQVWGWGAEDDEVYYRFLVNKLLERRTRRLRGPEEGQGYCDCHNDRDHTGRKKHWSSYKRTVDRIKRMEKNRNDTAWKVDGYKDTTYEVVRTFKDEYSSLWIQVDYAADQHSPSCVDSDGPAPVVVMSSGRSGSTNIWNTMGNLTGKVTFPDEYVGSSAEDVDTFFEEHIDGSWLSDAICDKQMASPEAGMVGFKWKPYPRSLSKPGFLEALRLSSTIDPPVRFIHSVRNPFDVALSSFKHELSNQPLRAHCKHGNTGCLEEHRKIASNMTFPAERYIMMIRDLLQQEHQVETLLKRYNVPHIKVTYEKLHFADDATEWMRIFEFIGVGPSRNLTMAQVQDAFQYAHTTSLSHREQVSNYEDVKKALTEVGYERFLRR